MRNAALIVDDFYKRNRIFDLNDKLANRDNCLNPYFQLQKEFKKNNFILNTSDISNVDFDILLFNEFRKINFKNNIYFEKYIIIFETELIKPDNWDLNNHAAFKKIFTWNDDFVDNKKYIKFYWPNNIPSNFKLPQSSKSYFCIMIAGNKLNFHENELYSERINAIKWFEKKHLDAFDLYGIGWDSGIDRIPIRYLKKNYYIHKIINKIQKHLEKITSLKMLIKNDFISYKGKIDNKNETLKKYKFSICYENAKGYPGYITEKIFDCFLAGCVPVYLGAPNITDFIPSNTFIDKRNFKTYGELYKFMKNMSEEEYSFYLKNIEKFMNSKEAKKFSAENFAKTIVNEIMKDIKSKGKK